MIGIVIPAHNEEGLLGECIDALQLAAAHPNLAGEKVEILVVLDNCTDTSAAIAQHKGVASLAVQFSNVGAARAAGVALLLEQGARWIACTDADSLVAEDWLAIQLALKADVVCGTVRIAHWDGISLDAQALYEANYQQRDGHRHVHGANLGFSAEAYGKTGGFQPLAVHEDVHLVEAFTRCGVAIAWSCQPGVVTSARRKGRAKGGFADHLCALQSSAQDIAISE